MKKNSYIIIFGWRLLRREWSRYILAAISLLITSVTFTVVLVSVDGARSYLSERSREFAGGDLTLHSGTSFDEQTLVAPLKEYIIAQDSETELTLAVRSDSGNTAVSVRAISEAFPLYGRIELEDGTYAFPADDGVYAERVALDRLGIQTGESLFIGAVPYRILGVITKMPDALVQGFQFAPTMIMSQAGLTRARINLAESRSEYEQRFRLSESPPREAIDAVLGEAAKQGIRGRLASEGQSGFLRRLENVERFFLIVILIGAILAAVNVYANAVAMVERLRKSFAILLIEGASERAVTVLVLGIITTVTLIATLTGVVFGTFLVMGLYRWIHQTTGVLLDFGVDYVSLGLVFLGTLATSLAAALPAIKDLLALHPRILLSGEKASADKQRAFLLLLGITALSFAPLLLLAAFFLESWLDALQVVGGALLAYVVVASLWALAIKGLYRWRSRFSFFLRIIIAQKRADGLFGVVALASLFIALTSIFTLTLAKSSLENFFDSGISSTLPSAYVLDVQKDQIPQVTEIVPQIILFPNIRARITRIDDRAIQRRLQEDNPLEDRELRREFNLTYRTDLLSDEQIVAGVWQEDRPGEVSVERDFARRANIQLGSEVEFFIQGLPVTAKVTSLRSAETTNGLPFFYFVFSPASLEKFPASYFGYANAENLPVSTIERELAQGAPNVTVLDTASVGRNVREVTATVLTLLATITLPPLLLATILLFTLVTTTFAGRQRDAVRLRVLGASDKTVTALYLADTTMSVLVSAIGAAMLSAGTVWLLTRSYLEGVQPVLFDQLEVQATLVLVVALLSYAIILMKTHKRSMREDLAYEENS